jgi:DNA polymerase-1
MLIDTESKYNDVIQDLIEYQSWAVDVETNGTDPYSQDHICGVGIGVSKDKGNTIDTHYFPFRHHEGENLPMYLLDDLLTSMSCRTELLGYNFKFDMRFLEKEGLDIEEKALKDVMLLVRLTASTTIRELALTKTIIRLYGPQAGQYDIDTKKILQKEHWNKDYSLAPPNILGPYCEKDVFWTYKLYFDCLAKIEASGQKDILELQYDLTKVLYEMERTGISIDSEYAEKAIEKIKARQSEVEQQIYKIAGREFNIKSTQEMGEVFHEFGIYSSLETDTGKESWSAAALAQIDHLLAGLIRQHRALHKLISTYLEPYIEKDVLHTSFCNWGAVTGRLSSRQPNLQNIPRNHFRLRDINLTNEELDVVKGRVESSIATKGVTSNTVLSDEVLNTWGFMGDESYDEKDATQVAIRRLFIARPGYKLVSFDYSQMEVRVFLSYLRNNAIDELLHNTDVDFHGEAAKIAFEITEDHSEFKYYRQMAKGITFGIIYGIGIKRLAQQLQTTSSKAAQYKKRYLDSIEGSREFIKGVESTVESRGWVKNRYGRIYKVPADMAYKGVNYLVQGTSADILNERLIAVNAYLKNTQSRLLLQVHDEIICEVEESEMDTVVPNIVELMQWNTLEIPLFVDKEVCTTSWATKIDYEKGYNKVQEKIEDYIDWS